MRHALFVPIFDALCDPTVVAGLAEAAERAGWDGFFCWDHVAYREPVTAIADPWVTLSAVACATERIRLGPMVTPLARRRPVQVAREVATLDALSQGRVTLGVGLGDDGAGEFAGTGEERDPRVRGQMLDESLDVLREAWTGETVRHRGQHYVLDGIAVRPRPLQQPHPPVWAAVRHGNRAPLRRAARCDGVFPIGLADADQLAEIIGEVASRRTGGGPFDVAVALPARSDPAPYASAGATWRLVEFSPYDLSVDDVLGVVRDGPG
ncbi:MAG TPA: LLM class flavin-dependent oxidoreductase [Nocardioidaceae bacterium]|nr:LLM class flavin-dependent oxidoreductase [Nocardioidaceae bacterium]